MLVLGWHGNPQLLESDDTPTFAFHDAAAAIVQNGVVKAAIEEERLNRVKHSNSFPVRAIRFCLEEVGATLRDVDAIVTDADEKGYDFGLSRDALFDPRLSFQSGREFLASVFEREFGEDVSARLQFCRHHMAHLGSAWYPSGLSNALAVCLDGDGDHFSGLIAHCQDDRVEVLRHLPEALSLGQLYTEMLFFLGYQRFDEYKAMGLAPYGDPAVHASFFQQIYKLQPQGRYELMPPFDRQVLIHKSGLTSRARRKGQSFAQEHKDFAAALQSTLERIVDHVVVHFQKDTRLRQLCLSGGVAHNCTMNGRLLRSGLFDQVYVQPAAHDAGNAVGAALDYLRANEKPISPDVMPHLYLGSSLGTAEAIGERLAQWQLCVEMERVPDAPQAAARLIADGLVIGWAQGRSEFGPRALGNRSILADCRPAVNKSIINAMVKKREDYRPFAPAVLEERLHDYFEVPAGTRSLPHMIFVVPVRPEAQARLGAITHVDGSARVQSVSRSDNPRFHALIEAFGELTGVPVVLNTSFNNNAEPIVESIDDCVTTFLTTGIHALVIGDWVVRKRTGNLRKDWLLDLSATLPSSRKLVKRTRPDGMPRYLIEPTRGRYASSPAQNVSPEVFRLLSDRSAGSIRAQYEMAGLRDENRLEEVAAELFELWSARAIHLSPCSIPGGSPL